MSLNEINQTIGLSGFIGGISALSFITLAVIYEFLNTMKPTWGGTPRKILDGLSYLLMGMAAWCFFVFTGALSLHPDSNAVLFGRILCFIGLVGYVAKCNEEFGYDYGKNIPVVVHNVGTFTILAVTVFLNMK